MFDLQQQNVNDLVHMLLGWAEPDLKKCRYCLAEALQNRGLVCIMTSPMQLLIICSDTFAHVSRVILIAGPIADADHLS